MVQNPYQNALLPAPVGGGYSDPDYWIWCGSVVQGEDGAYHMFASRWPKDLGFGANWLFNCEIVRASSKNPEGPYTFQEVVPVTRWTARVLPRSGTANESVLQPHRLFLAHGRGAMSR